MMHELHIESRPLNGVEILTLTGAVEQLSFPNLAATIGRSMHERSARIVLDCQRVNYIGSTQLRELMEFMAYARTLGGDIKFAGLAPSIRTVAGLVATNIKFDCYASVPDAVEAFREREAAVAH